MSDVTSEKVNLDEAFSLVSHDIRLEIIKQLADQGSRVSFETLRSSCGVEDPGHFRYHLNKLVGIYVTKTDSGYELTPVGGRVVGSIYSGVYTHRFTEESIETSIRCIRCATRLSATFDGSTVRLRCTECGSDVTDMVVPPTAITQSSNASMSRSVEDWIETVHQILRQGFCINCWGQLDSGIELHATETPEVPSTTTPMAKYNCDICGGSWKTTVGSAFVHHPTVVSFYYEHGTNVNDCRTWQLSLYEDENATVVSADPVEVELSIAEDGQTLTLRVNEQLEIVRTAVE